VRIGVGKTPPRGRLAGALAAGEDHAAMERALVLAPELVLSGEAQLLTHADLDRQADEAQRQQVQKRKLEALRARRLKRYVLSMNTAAGPRVIKIAEVNSAGNLLLGLLASSVSRQEHANHLRAEELGVAAADTLGFVEWRWGLHMVRACQVQRPLPDAAQTLDDWLAAELASRGPEALERFARALAATHRVPFFHADLKGFHAFVHPPADDSDYTLRWIDLARVSFHLSRRKRIINLYQALRFVVPASESARDRFLRAYCTSSGWRANAPERAIREVRRFLDYKLRTHPNP
jgi:hypothetical protein